MDYNKLSEKEFDDLMCEKYPLLYTDRHAPMNVTCMCWGFNIGMGWQNLVANLSEQLEDIIKNLPQEERIHYKAVQVKEKFGTLRFYMTAYTDQIDKYIGAAENLSATTCDKCGSLEAKLYQEGWMVTRCIKCKDIR